MFFVYLIFLANSIYSPTRSWISNRFFVGFIMGKDLWKCLVVNAALRESSAFPRGRDCYGFPDELDRRDDWIWRFGVLEVLELEEIEYRILIFG